VSERGKQIVRACLNYYTWDAIKDAQFLKNRMENPEWNGGIVYRNFGKGSYAEVWLFPL
jgi:hypothetical protein